MSLKKIAKYVFFVIPLIALLFFFQNCGLSGGSGAIVQYSEEDPSDIPAETYTYDLPMEVTPKAEAAKMNWNLDESNPAFIKAITALSNQCITLRQEFEFTQKVVPVIEDEGLLPGNPKIAEMAAAKSSIDKMLSVAFCAYFAKKVDERQKAFDAVAKFIIDWNTTYVGDGNPVNEIFFAKFFTAADLVMPLLSAEQIAALRALALRMDQKEAAYMASLATSNGRHKNNWKTRHLIIRLHANIILNNTTQLTTLRTALNQQLNAQFTAPAGFVLSTCANLRDIGAYGSFDLQERDALTTHLSIYTTLLPLVVNNPQILDAETKAKLLAALEITRPYVLGTKQHPEHKCSPLQYDKDRLLLDPTLGANWNPNGSRVAYRYARLIWPSVESWTESFAVSTEYSAWMKVIFSGKGDVL